MGPAHQESQVPRACSHSGWVCCWNTAWLGQLGAWGRGAPQAQGHCQHTHVGAVQPWAGGEHRHRGQSRRREPRAPGPDGGFVPGQPSPAVPAQTGPLQCGACGEHGAAHASAAALVPKLLTAGCVGDIAAAFLQSIIALEGIVLSEILLSLPINKKNSFQFPDFEALSPLFLEKATKFTSWSLLSPHPQNTETVP